MHVIFGFTISEWVGIVTIISMATAAVYRFVVTPLMNKFDTLSETLKKVNENSEIERQKLNQQGYIIRKHDSELGALYKDKGWTRTPDNIVRDELKGSGDI